MGGGVRGRDRLSSGLRVTNVATRRDISNGVGLALLPQRVRKDVTRRQHLAGLRTTVRALLGRVGWAKLAAVLHHLAVNVSTARKRIGIAEN